MQPKANCRNKVNKVYGILTVKFLPKRIFPGLAMADFPRAEVPLQPDGRSRRHLILRQFRFPEL